MGADDSSPNTPSCLDWRRWTPRRSLLRTHRRCFTTWVSFTWYPIANGLRRCLSKSTHLFFKHFFCQKSKVCKNESQQMSHTRLFLVNVGECSRLISFVVDFRLSCVEQKFYSISQEYFFPCIWAVVFYFCLWLIRDFTTINGN